MVCFAFISQFVYSTLPNIFTPVCKYCKAALYSLFPFKQMCLYSFLRSDSASVYIIIMENIVLMNKEQNPENHENSMFMFMNRQNIIEIPPSSTLGYI